MADMPEPKVQHRSPYSMIIFAALVYVFIITFREIAPIILAFLLVVLLSLALNPLVAALRDFIGHRSIATLLLICVFLGIIGFTGWAFYRPVKQSTSKFVQRLPEYWERIQRPLIKLEQQAAASEQRVKSEVRKEVVTEQNAKGDQPTETLPIERAPEQTPSQPSSLRPNLSGVIGGVTAAFKSVASNAATLVMTGITVIVGVIFTLLNPRPLCGLYFAIIPQKHHPKAMRIGQLIARMLPHWALATLLGMLVIGLMVFAVMWPILGLQDAIVLGLIACVFESVPFIGPILAVAPAVLLAVGKGGMTPLWVILGYAMIQMVENHFIAPVIVAGRLKLQPLAVIFSILICVTAFGVLGVLLAVPAVAIVNILIDELYRPRFSPDVDDQQIEELARTMLHARPQPSSQGATPRRLNRLRNRAANMFSKSRSGDR